MNTIYTYGYADTDPAQLDALAADLGAVIIDTRYTLWSRDPRWRGGALIPLFGRTRYAWYGPTLGNRNHQQPSAPIELANPKQAAAPIGRILEQRPIILLCQCKQWQTCHRSVAADYLAAQLGAPVEHLEPSAVAAPAGEGWTVLSLNPPWGSLVAACDGWPELGKHYETRSWRIKPGTQLAIYQTKGLGEQTKRDFVARCAAPFFRETLAVLDSTSPDDLPRGAILCTCRVVACHRTEQIRNQLSRRELAFGNYEDGRYAWELANVRRLPMPVPATATKQGLWTYRGPLVAQQEA